MELKEFIIFVESVENEIKETYSISGNWEDNDYPNALTATCESSPGARLLKSQRYQIHLWKDKNVAAFLVLRAGRKTKFKNLPVLQNY